mgnify:FL=1
MYDRIRDKTLRSRVMSSAEAAALIKDGMTVGTSGSTPAGYPKAVPLALAERVKREGLDLKISLWTGASVGDELDGALVDAHVVSRRLPYQSQARLRQAINDAEVYYTDQHLSHTAELVRSGQLGRLDVAIVEAVAITEDGGIVPSTSVGNSPTFVQAADRVIVELNSAQPVGLEGIHDIYIPENRPGRKPIPLVRPLDRIGTPYIPVDRDKIAAIVMTHSPDSVKGFSPPDAVSVEIAGHLCAFLQREVREGRLPENLLPLQSGVGNVANAVLGGLKEAGFRKVEVYSEVLQDAVFDLLDAGVVSCASGCSVTLSPEKLKVFFDNIDEYRKQVVLRPQEITNHPEIIRRLGLIAINTAVEIDIFGNVNSTHILGHRMLNGIGGSGDFTRNAHISIFVTPSTAKDGHISCIVPMVSHVDHTEHDVDVVVTECGLADLRGLSPRERARVIIDNCAHPDYRPELRSYLDRAERKVGGHTPHLLAEAFAMHRRFMEQGSMKAGPMRVAG